MRKGEKNVFCHDLKLDGNISGKDYRKESLNVQLTAQVVGIK